MIEAKNLTMNYGATVALDSVSFNVKENEVIGLLGPNGAGKTTLMRILTTFLYPTKGSAKIKGIDITEDPLSVRRMIGYLPETPPLYMDMRVDDFVDFVGRSRGLAPSELKKRKEWVIDAVKIAGVWKHMISELSLGYRQRVGLAQALIHDPQVVILDEPTSGLDPMQIVGIRRLIKELALKKTIIFSTHILQEASAVADYLMVIDRGKIIARGTIPELKKERAGEHDFYISLQAGRAEAEEGLRSLSAIKEIRFLDDTHHISRFACFSVSFDEAAAAVNLLAREKGWLIRELSRKEFSLEDVFLALFRKREEKA